MSNVDDVRPAAAGGRPPWVTKVGPLGIVAVAWIAISVLFPTKEADRSLIASGAQGSSGATFDEGSFDSSSGVPGSSGEGGSITGDIGAGGTPTGGGSAGAAGAAPGAAQGQVATAKPGTTRGGADCKDGVRQIPTSSYAAPCMAAWSGDNGGATARGVSANEIVIVERTFPDTANSQAVEAVGQQAGAATEEQATEVWENFKKYFNAQYEMYGRTVKWVKYESQFGNSTDEVQSKGREGACLDADVVANEIKAFGVVATRGTAVSGPFAECAAERGLVVFNGAAYFPERFYKEHHPFVWAVTMDCERISNQFAEYVGKRIAGRKARWAGDPTFQARNRTFGTYVPNNDEYQFCVNVFEKQMESKYGVKPGSRYNYTLDVSRFPDEAARGIVQFRADGATTLVMACDPISMIFLTQSATSQAYNPEWLLLGVALQDTDNLAQLYDQQQADGHMFGMSQLGRITDLLGAKSEAGRVYQAATGKTIYDGTDGGYPGLMLVYNFIQAAGPNLTAQSIAANVTKLPIGGAPAFPYGMWNFATGPDGAPGSGDHTAVEDSREIYWTSEFVSPETGLAGTFVETYDGKRFTNGQWPSEEPKVYPGA